MLLHKVWSPSDATLEFFCIFMTNKPWTEDEFVLALELYFRIPFGSISKSNPDIIKLANLLGRTPSSVAMRLSNYAHVDPNLKANGLSGGGKNCSFYWEKYANNLPQLKIDAALSRIRIIENIWIVKFLFNKIYSIYKL